MVRHGARHDYSRVQSVLDALNKRVLLVARGFGETLADVLQASDRLVLQLHPRLGGYDLDLCCDQEAQGSTGPGDSMEEVRVLLLGVGQRKVAGSCFTHSTLNVLTLTPPPGLPVSLTAHSPQCSGPSCRQPEPARRPRRCAERGRRCGRNTRCRCPSPAHLQTG